MPCGTSLVKLGFFCWGGTGWGGTGDLWRPDAPQHGTSEKHRAREPRNLTHEVSHGSAHENAHGSVHEDVHGNAHEGWGFVCVKRTRGSPRRLPRECSRENFQCSRDIFLCSRMYTKVCSVDFHMSYFHMFCFLAGTDKHRTAKEMRRPLSCSRKTKAAQHLHDSTVSLSKSATTSDRHEKNAQKPFSPSSVPPIKRIPMKVHFVFAGAPTIAKISKSKKTLNILKKAVGSQRGKSRSVPEGGADFPAAVFLARKCPDLGRDSISCCRKISEEFARSVEICRGKTFPARNFGQPQPSRVFGNTGTPSYIQGKFLRVRRGCQASQRKGWPLGKSGKLPGNPWIAVKFHSERTSGEVAEKLPGKFGELPGKSGDFPEARGSLTPSQRLAKFVSNIQNTKVAWATLRWWNSREQAHLRISTPPQKKTSRKSGFFWASPFTMHPVCPPVHIREKLKGND